MYSITTEMSYKLPNFKNSTITSIQDRIVRAFFKLLNSLSPYNVVYFVILFNETLIIFSS